LRPAEGLTPRRKPECRLSTMGRRETPKGDRERRPREGDRERGTVRAESSTDPRLWWVRPGLEVRAGQLKVAGRDAETLARTHGTPLYVFDLLRIGEQVRGLQEALSRAGLTHRVRQRRSTRSAERQCR
jgi:hypothetical protein